MSSIMQNSGHLNSALYSANIMHKRISPKVHAFNYRIFMFYIDLDELELLSRKLWMFSVDRFNFFSFRKNEHLQLPIQNPDKSKSTKEQVINYLQQKGFKFVDHKIMLLTNCNILGYNFNPVSFYFILNKDKSPACAIAEVGNTFGEMKPYYLPIETFSDGAFNLKIPKEFYVSPFFDHDTTFQFRLQVPTEQLQIQVNDFKGDERIFVSSLNGKKSTLNNLNLFLYSIRFPFLTLRIIFLIHFNALRLWLKRLPFHPKAAFPELQKDVFRKFERK